MGMVLVARRVSPGEIAAVEAEPHGAHELLSDETGEGSDSGRIVDIDKSWDAIRILLSGPTQDAPAPAGLAIVGGREIGEDNGYGPARLLDPALVIAVSVALDAVGDDDLEATYRAHVRDRPGVYPSGVFGADEFESYVLPNINELRALYRAAADAGEAVLVGLL